MYTECGRICGCVLLFLIFGSCSAQIGSKCTFLSCRFARHAACDANNICRCKPDYPVQVSPLKCAKARRNLEVCTDSKECTVTDANMYCSQTSSQSRCECHIDFTYTKSQDPVNLSFTHYREIAGFFFELFKLGGLALSSMLCCFLALWRLCKRANNNFLSSLQTSGSVNSRATREHTPVRTQDSWSSDTLPSYEAAVSLKVVNNANSCLYLFRTAYRCTEAIIVSKDPPPPYSEAVTLQLPLSETKV
ncbi:uncharacterized protein LOC119378191 [Rhipicephalus sanguineus]|uniref:uncharacterized protein LOC119378191 n=1 Tax=Rhipicephalus sanguineus TaxID=34632 RepID=UPI0020C537F0|nr:uncharacterized protein LOC119378191 [Rhipicephalus sanguineus]